MTRNEWDKLDLGTRVKVKYDKRPWMFTSTRMRMGKLYLRVVYYIDHPDHPPGKAIRMYKKLVPASNVTVL